MTCDSCDDAGETDWSNACRVILPAETFRLVEEHVRKLRFERQRRAKAFWMGEPIKRWS